jgi:hypothetical protein
VLVELLFLAEDYLEVVLDLTILGSIEDFDSFTMAVVSSLVVQRSAVACFAASDSTVA